mgnify:CR=1 FL=1
MDIEDFLLLERKIDQINSKIQVLFSFDVIKTNHAEKRKDFNKRNLNDKDHSFITNKEMAEFIDYFKRDIAMSISVGKIDTGEEFVIRSKNRDYIAMVIIPEYQVGSYWKLIIKTVFRESYDNQFRVGKDQIILER